MAMMNLSEQDLNNIFGGLSYLGKEIDKSKTIEELCSEYPILREKLGGLCTILSSTTVQELIDIFGESMLQKLIDENG